MIELTKGQKEAMDLLKKWWKNKDKQIFEIAGYAGTGKSSLIYSLMDEIGLTRENVKFATYTGKASLVLNRKGVPATTVHRLIYTPEEVIKIDPETKKIISRKVKFIKKEKIDSNIQLLVLDECSMIDKDMLSDIKSFGVPIIVLGDRGQLPPIHGEIILLKNPDVILTEIMRQNEGDPIVHLSFLAREGKRINKGRYGPKALVCCKSEITDNILLKANIIIVGKNKTRQSINDYIRYDLLERKKELPEVNDKIICRKNDWSIEIEGTPLINGIIGYCKNPITDIDYGNRTFQLDFRPEFCKLDYFENLNCTLDTFIPPDINDKDHYIDYSKQKFEFAYAITTHLSQGSQYNSLVLFEERLGDKEFHRKWLYTGITRAEKLIVIGQ